MHKLHSTTLLGDDDDPRTLRDVAHENLDRLLRRSRDEPWVCVKATPGLHIFHDQGGSTYQAAAVVDASMDEIKGFVSLVTTEEMRANIGQHMYEDILDSNILHAVAADERIFVRWLALACPSPMRNRDACLLEAHDDIILPTGRRAYVISQHSVPFAACADNEATLNVVRASITDSGLIVSETGTPGQCRVQLFLSMDLRGRGPQWLTKRVMLKRVARLQSLHAAVANLRRAKMSMGGDFSMYGDNQSECGRCHKRFQSSFSLKRRLFQCTSCCHTFCRQCTVDASKGRKCHACWGASTGGCFRSPYPSSGPSGYDVGMASPCRQYSPNVTRQQLQQWIHPAWVPDVPELDIDWLGPLPPSK
ncbi:hypothetical protein SPRG_07781 [Saprolegnia parasitica CBS 223.65]|uniref:FYVE-type domain-containing protein n=1 Tax=Saprolegnia parasitica (strain CBS 223.65) TaxID=695850 RepID=A0A067CD10_SAPPC|nr:hypothetical protein SPRG_07781 [Saprolegnia parasitica CBS 223.65]KDO27070.1 hypothetical protein SPRG_07781 [Saprolegnia parasitica CBS 223.65]|eukprot:XP_012202165.1 hypothetical protein SPRG_07781 [Saprolegnia parasitica CBS 223.65]